MPTLLRAFAAALISAAVLVRAQIPASEKLSDADELKFLAEIERIEKMLATATDPATVEFALARTWAAGGQFSKAMEVLKRVVARDAGIDPSGDRFLAKVEKSVEFERLLRRVRRATKPVLSSRHAFTLTESDLNPEGMTFDPRGNRFLFGSMTKSKIMQCDAAGNCRQFAAPEQNGLAEVLGIAVSPLDGSIWAASNSATTASLFHFEPDGKLIARHDLSRKPDPHLFNDVVVDANGNAYSTDTSGRTVYWVARESGRLEPLIPGLRVVAANGIAVTSGPNPTLFVSGFPDGITVVDLTRRTFRGIGIPKGLCLATIDGLYYTNGTLVAIQNGAMSPRVVRLHLSKDRNAISRFRILERRNPLFDNPTTGAINGKDFYFMANSQVDKAAGFNYRPIQVLRVRVD